MLFHIYPSFMTSTVSISFLLLPHPPTGPMSPLPNSWSLIIIAVHTTHAHINMCLHTHAHWHAHMCINTYIWVLVLVEAKKYISSLETRFIGSDLYCVLGNKLWYSVRTGLTLKHWVIPHCFLKQSFFFKFFLLRIFLNYISNAIPNVPHTLPPPTPLSTHSHFLALAFPCTGAYKVCLINGPLFPVMAD